MSAMETTQDIKESSRAAVVDAWATLQAHARNGEPLSPDAYRLAFADPEFLLRTETRGIRFQLELLKPDLGLAAAGVNNTVVVYGSARVIAPDVAEAQLAAARASGDAAALGLAENAARGARYYAAAREFARIVAEHTWLPTKSRRADVVHHGGGTVPLLAKRPIVLTVHDLQYVEHPGYFSAARLRYLRWMMPRSVRHTFSYRQRARSSHPSGSDSPET